MRAWSDERPRHHYKHGIFASCGFEETRTASVEWCRNILLRLCMRQ
jgi:hypothetical protein